LPLLFLGLSIFGCESNSTPIELLEGDGRENLEAQDGDPAVVLRSVIELIRAAPDNPGGSNFTDAAETLDDYFRGTRAEDFAVPPRIAEFLAKQTLPPNANDAIRRRGFDGQFDGRHLDDCLLLRDVTKAILSRGAPLESDLPKAERLFAWIVRNIQLVPPGFLGPPGARMPNGDPMQPPARPYDVLVRGFATEEAPEWADRSWLFLALCRQAGIDAGYLALVNPSAKPLETGVEASGELPVRPFVCGVLANNKVYLFDLRLGLPIRKTDGSGIASLDDVANDTAILKQFDLPNSPYNVQESDLSASKVRVLLDATLCSLAPRMKLVQEQLSGEDRMVLYRDPTEQAEKFRIAVGHKLEGVYLWSLPLNVEFLLFHETAFNKATGFPMQPFNHEWPLLRARLMQLRGELDQAINSYVGFRFAEDTMDVAGKKHVGREVQQVLDVYATQFLALAQLDKGRPDEAIFLFSETLRLLPEPAAGLPFFTAFRWGANLNLGVLYEQKGEIELAVRYFSEFDPTYESIGKRLRARSLIWEKPFVPDSEVPMPTRPPQSPVSARTAVPAAGR
jgi:tetratricopeptide (TPR) repeat protein